MPTVSSRNIDRGLQIWAQTEIRTAEIHAVFAAYMQMHGCVHMAHSACAHGHWPKMAKPLPVYQGRSSALWGQYVRTHGTRPDRDFFFSRLGLQLQNLPHKKMTSENHCNCVEL